MKAICTFACQFRGVLVKEGTILDVTDEEAKSGQFKSSFKPYDPAKGVAVDSEGVRDSFGMTAQDYRNKLDAFKAVYGPTDTIDELRKKLERITSGESRKRVKPQ